MHGGSFYVCNKYRDDATKLGVVNELGNTRELSLREVHYLDRYTQHDTGFRVSMYGVS